MSKRKLENDPVSSITDEEASAIDRIIRLEKLSSLPSRKKTPNTLAATEITGSVLAAKLLDIDWDPKSADYNLALDDEPPTGTLSPSFATIIEELNSSRYFQTRCDESISRTTLDLILIDRLRNLQGRDVEHQLCLSADVPISVKVKDFQGNNEVIQGRADWALGYGINKNVTGSILVVAKADRSETAPIGLAQLMVYMAAIYESRVGKDNNRVFGMLADSTEFKFCYIDCTRKLLVSNTFRWATQQSTILTYLDTILLDTFKTSPSAKPARVNARNRPRYFKGLWRFGPEDEIEDEEDMATNDNHVEQIKVENSPFVESSGGPPEGVPRKGSRTRHITV